MMKPLKTKVSITLDIDLVDAVREMAEKDERSFSQYINLILKQWVAAKYSDKSRKEIRY